MPFQPTTTLMRSPDGKSVEMMNRQKMEVGLRCVKETKRRGDREWKMAEGYKMLHAGRYGGGLCCYHVWRMECGDQQANT